jgi:hypothetical protein
MERWLSGRKANCFAFLPVPRSGNRRCPERSEGRAIGGRTRSTHEATLLKCYAARAASTERWLSGRKQHGANVSSGLNWIEGSNPSLSAFARRSGELRRIQSAKRSSRRRDSPKLCKPLNGQTNFGATLSSFQFHRFARL